MTRYRRPETAEQTRAKSMFWNAIALLFGWTLFLYWWWVVLGRTNRHVLWHLLGGLGLLAGLLVVFSVVWILHNLRLAGRSRRHRATPYNPGTFERDKLDRRVVLDDLHVLREASVIVVESTGEQKRYVESEIRDSA